MGTESLLTTTQLQTWVQTDIEELWTELEAPNWAPWLAASPAALLGRSIIFPEGQLLLCDSTNQKILASLSTNRIQWNGSVEALPSWDTIAGEPTTYEHTYNPFGNTLVLMSMNVRPSAQGLGLARTMLHHIRNVAANLGVNYAIGSFRPNEYGKHKFLHPDAPLSFTDYCKLAREDNFPVDSWLRNLVRNGMLPLVVDKTAMVVSTDLGEFDYYRSTYQPDMWRHTQVDAWECGEVGRWHIDNQRNIATYVESNLWGRLK